MNFKSTKYKFKQKISYWYHKMWHCVISCLLI